VLQEGQYERVGEEATRQVDVRIIAATNRDLKSSIEKGRFRQDLYYRLNVFPIEVAPLRLRKKDIPLLAEHFLGLIQKRGNRELPQLSTSNLKQLQNYDWPGNVRELQNVIERAAITSQGRALQFVLPDGEEPGNLQQAIPFGLESNDEWVVVPESEMRLWERKNIIAALKQSNWKIFGPEGAAQLLGIKPTTLSSRIKKMKIRKPTV
jgi:transcriptional regulator with GAF, ATPase, and Fis domain